MSDLSNFMSDYTFVPSKFDSILNPHSLSSDNSCNIDDNLNCDCKYYDTNTFNEGVINQGDFSVFHLNTRSLGKKASGVVDYCSAIDHDFDVYAFTETWFNSEDDSNLIDLDNYSNIDCIRYGRTGGGTSLFIHPKHNFIRRPDLKINATDCDSLFIEIPGNDIIVGTIYKPDYVDFDQFISQLESVLSTVTKEKKRCYIAGDFNLDLLKYDRSAPVSSFVNLMYSHYFFPCIDKPTRVVPGPKGTSISLIDNIFTNDVNHKLISGNLVTDLSDHFPNFISVKGSRYKNYIKPSYKNVRQLNDNNIKGFKNSISLVDWDFITHDNDPDNSYTHFINKITELLDFHCPIKTTKISKRKTPRKPWVTLGILKSIKSKDKLYKKYITKPTIDNKIKYTKFRNILNNLLRASKRSHITSEIESNKFNMKDTWRTLNTLLGRNKRTKIPDFFKDKDDNKITDSNDIANNFNNFFTNIGSKLADKISDPDDDYSSPLKSVNQKNSMFLKPTTPEEILDITNKLKQSNSCGFDNISSRLLKAIIDDIAPILSHIFNRSLATGKVPSQLKIAKVTPIFKSGDNKTFSNYRPISILPSISKILEKIMYVRLHDFITLNNILSPHQYGFRAKRSTYMAINDLYCKITNDLDNKLHSLGIFLDLSKAFDTLNHEILLHKLNTYGIRGHANAWIESYLSDRKQHVVFNQKTSFVGNIVCGVPQGSILGPLLFLIYINDLPLSSPTSHFIIFADDTNILFSHKDPDQLETLINKELNNISNWFKLNKLSLNIDKTNFMTFKNKHSKTPDLNFKIVIDNINIEKVKITKFLGILIDNNLSWKAHTSHISKIVSKYNGIIRKIRTYLTQDSLHTLYNTLVLPYLSYCTIVWGDRNNTNLESLFILQKKIIRTCTNSLWLEHTTPLFISLKKLKIRDIYTNQLAIHMFKYNNKLLPHDLPATLFTNQYDVHNYPTRHASDLHIALTHSKLAENTFRTQGPLIWNHMNINLKNCKSLAIFKKRLNNYINAQYQSEIYNNEYASIT